MRITNRDPTSLSLRPFRVGIMRRTSCITANTVEAATTSMQSWLNIVQQPRSRKAKAKASLETGKADRARLSERATGRDLSHLEVPALAALGMRSTSLATICAGRSGTISPKASALANAGIRIALGDTQETRKKRLEPQQQPPQSQGLTLLHQSRIKTPRACATAYWMTRTTGLFAAMLSIRLTMVCARAGAAKVTTSTWPPSSRGPPRG